MENKKFAYKGTDLNMNCIGTQFELGATYFINGKNEVEKLPDGYVILSAQKEIKTCTRDVIHYCNELNDVFGYYSNNGSNRFFKVEILGNFVDDTDKKSGTTCIKFVGEISKEELKDIQDKKDREKLDSAMKINQVKTLQTLNPNLVIGGSIALYLHGVRLKRFKGSNADYDFCLPYYQVLKGDENVKVGEIMVEKDWDEDDDEDGRGYSSDFETVITINGVKADVRVDPKQRYEIVKYNDFDFKVTPLLRIIEAKIKYAKTKWGSKHKDDLTEMILNK